MTSNSTDFHLDCTRWWKFTSPRHVGKKDQCCWSGNYMRHMIISLT